jgi:hypothetical protein
MPDFFEGRLVEEDQQITLLHHLPSGTMAMILAWLLWICEA